MSPQKCNSVKVAVSAVLLVLVARSYATTGKLIFLKYEITRFYLELIFFSSVEFEEIETF